jgi:hypothetical protein
VHDVFVREPDGGAPTRTVYLGTERGGAGNELAVSASLADAITGEPVVDEVVTFELVNETGAVSMASTSTDEAGVASTTVALPGGDGAYRMVASYAGFSERQSSSSGIRSCSQRHTTTTTYVGGRARLSERANVRRARVTDESGKPVEGVAVRFALKDGDEALREEIATSTASGIASAYLRLDVPIKDYTLHTAFDGDTLASPAPMLVLCPCAAIPRSSCTAEPRAECAARPSRYRQRSPTRRRRRLSPARP